LNQDAYDFESFPFQMFRKIALKYLLNSYCGSSVTVAAGPAEGTHTLFVAGSIKMM